MSDTSKRGEDWNEEELDLIVQTYFAILGGLPTAERGFKADMKRALDAQIDRGIGSIDFKLGNLSYIATEIGLPELPGFVPARKAQKGPIYRAFDRYVSAHPELLADEAFLSKPGGSELSSVREPAGEPWPDPGTLGATAFLPTDSVPPPSDPKNARPEGLVRLVRKFDPAARDHRNRVLGRLGEQYVLNHEIARLIAADKMKLALQVEWTSDVHGDGAGYDIKSFEPDGSDRLIEVKSTKGGPTTDFFITRTEREVSMERPDAWRLYRLHSLPTAPRLFVLPPPLEQSVRLEAENWRAQF
ncbi:MAG: DUF3883 domain-containing protein [Caulobacter sp.]